MPKKINAAIPLSELARKTAERRPLHSKGIKINMGLKSAVRVAISSIVIMLLITSVLPAAADDDNLTYEIGKEFTAENDADTYFFDESFGSEIAVNAMKLIVSLTVVDFNANNGFGLKFIINNNSNSDDFYFLTMSTNSWAYSGTKNPIEADKKGTYTLEFDLSKLGQVASIQGDLWQGTVILNGLQILDESGKELTSYGNIIEPTVGYYKAGVGRVVNTTTAETTTTSALTTTTQADNQTVSIATTIVSNNNGSGISFFWIGIPAIAIGVILIVLAIVFTKKMK